MFKIFPITHNFTYLPLADEDGTPLPFAHNVGFDTIRSMCSLRSIFILGALANFEKRGRLTEPGDYQVVMRRVGNTTYSKLFRRS